MGCPFLLQEIFLTQGSNQFSCTDRWILYRLSHQGSSPITCWATLRCFVKYQKFLDLISAQHHDGQGAVTEEQSCQ